MLFEPYEASFEVEFTDKFKIEVTDAKVHKGSSNLIILGDPGLVSNKVEVRVNRTHKNKALEVWIRGKRLSDLWPNSSLITVADRSMLLSESPKERAPTTHTHLFENSVVVNASPTSSFDPDGTRA